MAATVIHRSIAPLALDVPHAAAAPPSTPLPTIDLSSASADEAHATLSRAASTTGAALITNLAVRPPIGAIQRLFATLYGDRTLAARLNATYPTRGVFKAACLDPESSPDIDQKTTVDLSAARLRALRRLDPALVADLGADFDDVLRFYAVVEEDVLPLLVDATSRVVGCDLAPLHASGNNNLRLIDYFPAAAPSGPRCGEHIDYGTYTIVFQDGTVGGLEFETGGDWVQVPANVDAVVSWGWCAAILSDDRVKAAKHRVMRTRPVQKRRTTAVVFAAPDMDAVLKPVTKGDDAGIWSERIMEGKLSVGQFKEVISKRWRRREGNEEGDVVEGAQDREVLAFVKG